MPSKRIVLSLLAVLFLSFFAYAAPAHAQTAPDLETQQQLASLSAYFNSLKSLLLSLQNLISQSASLPSAQAASSTPSAPSGLTATMSGTSVLLNWTDTSNNEDGFYIYRSFNGGSWVSAGSNWAGPNATSTTADTGLAAGSYDYHVNAFNSVGASAYSNTVTVSVTGSSDTTPPSTPTGLSATVISSSQINLSWTASTDNVGVAGYRTYKNGTYVSGSEVTGTSYNSTGLSAATSYTYTVAAYDASGNISSQSNSVSATTLSGGGGSSCTGFTLTLANNKTSYMQGETVTYTWACTPSGTSSFNEVSILKPDGSLWGVLNSGTGSGLTLGFGTSVTLFPLGTYTLRICSIAGCTGGVMASVSFAITADTAAPPTPTGLSATAGSSSQINLTWNWPSSNVGIAGYKVYRNNVVIATLVSGSLTATSSASGTFIWYADTGLSPGTSYSYTIATYNTAGTISPQTNSVSATTLSSGGGGADTTPPSTPTNLGIGASTSTTQITIYWNLSTDNVGVVGYKIYRNGSYFTSIANANGWYSDTGLSAGTTYSYTVAAYDAAGNVSSQSASVSATTQSSGGGGGGGDTTPPSTPTGVYITGTIGVSSSYLYWNASTDNVGVAGYKVYQNGVFLINIPSTLPTALGNLSPSYNYTVAAYDAAGNLSAQSATVSVSSSSTTTSTVPAAPSNLIYSLSNSNATVNLSWTDNSTNETRFEIYKQYSGIWNYLTQTSANVTSFSDNPPVGTYYYNVAACNGTNPGGGCSVGSNTVGPITPSYNSTTPNAPSNLTATASSSNVYLNWTDNSTNESGFKIYDGPTRGDIGNVGANVNYYTDSNLAAGTYYYKVQAFVSASSSYPVYSSISNEVTVTVGGGGVSSSTILRDTNPPSTPAGLTAVPVSSSQINLSWGASTDNYGVMGYKVFRNGTYFVSVGSPSYSDIGLAAGTPQSYTVAAYDAAGNVSPQSAVIFAATFASAIASSTVSSVNSYINGSAMDSSGAPIASVGIHVYKADFSLNFSGITDSNGAFSINLPAGDYLVEVNLPFSRYDLVKPDVIKVSVASGETKNLALKFAGTVKTLSGRVVFSNGQTVTDAEVGVFSNSTYQWTTAALDATGNYTLKVGKGRWQINVRPTASSKWSYSDSPREVEFSPDNVSETKTVNFVIPVTDVALAIKTIDQSGAVIVGAGIVIDTVSAGQQSVGTSRPAPQYARGDSAGSATFTLKAGTYFVRAFLPPEQGFSNPDEARVEAVSGDTKQVNLVFRKRDASTTVPVNGVAKLGDGTPIDAFVWAWSEQGGFLQGRSTTDGKFIFQVPKNTKWHVGAGKELNGVPYKTSEVIVAVTDTGTSVELALAKLNDIFLAPSVNVTQSATEQVVVQAEDGAKMTLPPNAAGSSGNVNVSIDPTVEAPSQGGARTIGAIYDVKATDQSGNQVKSLQSEAEIVLPYNKDDLKKQGVSEKNIVPSYFDDSTGTWRACENYTINKEKSVAICRVKHLTRFAIVAAADVVPPDPPANVKPVKNESGEIVISSVNPTKDFSHVKIYRSTVKGSLGQIILDNVTVSQSKDKSAVPGTTYYYTVRAVDPAGNESTNTDQVSASGSKAKAVVKFSRSLRLGMSGDDVTALQEVLINERVYPEAAVTGYFGPKTKIAVVKFQEKYKADILAPAGLEKGNGFVGAGSRVKLDLIYKALLDSGAINQ